MGDPSQAGPLQEGPSGIAGVLLVFVFLETLLVLGLAWAVFVILPEPHALHDLWEAVPQAAELVLLDLVGRALLLVATVAGLVLVFRRSATTPRFYQVYFGALVLYALLMVFAANNARVALDAYSTWENGMGVIRRFRGIPTTSAWASTNIFVQTTSTALLWG